MEKLLAIFIQSSDNATKVWSSTAAEAVVWRQTDYDEQMSCHNCVHVYPEKSTTRTLIMAAVLNIQHIAHFSLPRTTFPWPNQLRSLRLIKQGFVTEETLSPVVLLVCHVAVCRVSLVITTPIVLIIIRRLVIRMTAILLGGMVSRSLWGVVVVM